MKAVEGPWDFSIDEIDDVSSRRRRSAVLALAKASRE